MEGGIKRWSCRSLAQWAGGGDEGSREEARESAISTAHKRRREGILIMKRTKGGIGANQVRSGCMLSFVPADSFDFVVFGDQRAPFHQAYSGVPDLRRCT